nr:MAG TPA: hypothetical protein [Caudoviricetes sp.]
MRLLTTNIYQNLQVDPALMLFIRLNYRTF